MDVTERFAYEPELVRSAGAGRNENRLISVREQVVYHYIRTYSRVRAEMQTHTEHYILIQFKQVS